VGIIEYLLAFFAVVVAVLGSAIVYAARFRWKIGRAVALAETLPRNHSVEVEALRGP
jgi:Tfp pilus assembly protein PilN